MDAARKISYREVNVFKCLCTAITIFFAVKQSCYSILIELLLLSVKTNALSEKIALWHALKAAHQPIAQWYGWQTGKLEQCYTQL